MKDILPCIAIVFLVVLSSCKETTTEPENNNDTPINTPVLTNVLNSFTYTIIADHYSDQANNTLQFTSDSLTIVLSSFGYGSGHAIITVRDVQDAVIFADTVTSNATTVIADMKMTRPQQCTVALTNFTSTLTFELVGVQ